MCMAVKIISSRFKGLVVDAVVNNGLVVVGCAGSKHSYVRGGQKVLDGKVF